MKSKFLILPGIFVLGIEQYRFKILMLYEQYFFDWEDHILHVNCLVIGYVVLSYFSGAFLTLSSSV